MRKLFFYSLFTLTFVLLGCQNQPKLKSFNNVITADDSLGSVGSSFAAYLAGITEVNSLRPHYLCPKCRYSDFDSDIVKKYHDENTCGIDLPDAVCPKCGEKLMKLGFDIPFETFL